MARMTGEANVERRVLLRPSFSFVGTFEPWVASRIQDSENAFHASLSVPVLGLEENLGGDLALDDAAEEAGGAGGHVVLMRVEWGERRVNCSVGWDWNSRKRL